MLSLFLLSTLAASPTQGTIQEAVWTVQTLDVPPALAVPSAVSAGWSEDYPVIWQTRRIGAVLRDNSGSKRRVLLGSDLGPEVDSVRNLTTDGKHVAYCARSGNRTLLCLDARQFELPEGSLKQVGISPDGQHVAHALRRNGQVFVGQDGRDVAGPLEKLISFDTSHARSWCLFAPDGASFACIGSSSSDGMQSVYWSDKCGPGHASIDASSLVFSADGSRLAYAADRQQVVILGGAQAMTHAAPGVVPHSLVFSPDSRHLAYADSSGVHVDGALLCPDRCDQKATFPVTGAPGSRCLWWQAGRDQPAFVVLTPDGVALRKDGDLWPTADQIRAGNSGFDAMSGRLAVVARRGSQWSWVVEGAPGEGAARIGPIVFADGNHTAYCIGPAALPVEPGLPGGSGAIGGQDGSPLDRVEQRLGGASMDRLEQLFEGPTGYGQVARTLDLFTLTIDGRRTSLPPSLDIVEAPVLSPDRTRIAYRTARGLSADRRVPQTPGVCVVDVTATPPTHVVHGHEDAQAIDCSPVFSPDGSSVAYLVRASSGVTVAVDGVVSDKSFAAFSRAPHFTGPDRLEATAVALDGAAPRDVPIVVTRSTTQRPKPQVPAPSDQPSAPLAEASSGLRPARELFIMMLRLQPAKYWFEGSQQLSDAELAEADTWCRTNLPGKQVEFDAVLDGYWIDSLSDGVADATVVLSSEALLTVARGNVDMVLDASFPGLMELQLQMNGIDPSFMPNWRPFLWRVRMPLDQLRRLDGLVGQYLPVKARLGMIEELGGFVGRPSFIMMTDAMAVLGLSLRDIEVSLPAGNESGIERIDRPSNPPSFSGGAGAGMPCGFCNGVGYLQDAHGTLVGGMQCSACGGRGWR